MANHQMVNVHWTSGAPELASIASHFGVPLQAFDASFGVIEVTPGQVYCVRVESPWAERIAGTPQGEGPFPDGRIEPFGPPKD